MRWIAALEENFVNESRKAALPGPKVAPCFSPLPELCQRLIFFCWAWESRKRSSPTHGVKRRRAKEASAIGAAEIAFYFNPTTEVDNAAGTIVEGMLLASYQFNKYRSNS